MYAEGGQGGYWDGGSRTSQAAFCSAKSTKALLHALEGASALLGKGSSFTASTDHDIRTCGE